jgi:hypothetical protein
VITWPEGNRRFGAPSSYDALSALREGKFGVDRGVEVIFDGCLTN